MKKMTSTNEFYLMNIRNSARHIRSLEDDRGVTFARVSRHLSIAWAKDMVDVASDLIAVEVEGN